MNLIELKENLVRVEISKGLELNADEVVFIDDNSKNCDGATKLGIKSIILARNLIRRINDLVILRVPYKVVKNIYEVEKLLKSNL